MFKISENANENYLGQIVELTNLKKLENSDNLQVVSINYNNVITGLNAKEGDIYLYFPILTLINHDFLSATNSFKNKEFNKDDVEGYFNHRGLVKAINLRSAKSQGYIVPIETFENWLTSIGYNWHFNKQNEVKVGDKFDSFDNLLICQKYNRKVQKQEGTPGKKKSRDHNEKLNDYLIENQFRFYHSTQHLNDTIRFFNINDYVFITQKLHGSSFILSNVLVKQLNFLQKLSKRYGFVTKIRNHIDFILKDQLKNNKPHVIKSTKDIVDFVFDKFDEFYLFLSKIIKVKNDYGFVVSSGKPKSGLVKSISTIYQNMNGDYYNRNIWEDEKNKIKHIVPKGYTIYGEIVGHNVQGGYTYGVPESENTRLYVYKITITNPEGVLHTMDFHSMSLFCKNNGLYVVPLLFEGYLNKFGDNYDDIMRNLSDTFLEKMLPNKLPDEGICIQTLEKKLWHKYRSHAFKMKESKDAENEVIDIEEEQ